MTLMNHQSCSKNILFNLRRDRLLQNIELLSILFRVNILKGDDLDMICICLCVDISF